MGRCSNQAPYDSRPQYLFSKHTARLAVGNVRRCRIFYQRRHQHWSSLSQLLLQLGNTCEHRPVLPHTLTYTADRRVWWTHGLLIRHFAVSLVQQLGARASRDSTNWVVGGPAAFMARVSIESGEETARLAEVLTVSSGRI